MRGLFMKQFFSTHSYNMVKMFLNQFAIALFGFILVLAAGQAENTTLRNVTSVFAILFYLFLLYVMTWEIGFRDKVSVETGRKKRNPFTGALISLCANSINFILAIFIMLASLLDVAVLSNIGGVCASIAVFIEGMYTGLLANHVGGTALNSYWFVYFLLPIPAMVTCGIAYQLGVHDIKFTSLFDQVYPESDREPSKKRKNNHD